MAVNPTGPDAPGARTTRPEEVGRPSPPSRRPRAPAGGGLGSDLVTATGAVVTVSAALARYVLERPARRSGVVVRRLGSAHVVRREGHRLRASALPLVTDLLHRVVTEAGHVADAVVPALVREVLARIDVTSIVLENVDLDRLAGALDVDAVVARIDVDAIVAQLDLNAVAAGLDLDALVEKVDVGRVIDRVDLDEVVSRVDLDRAVERVHVERIIDRVDLDEVVDRVDLDRAVSRVDLDRVIDRADIVGIARYVIAQIDLPDLIRTSTGSVSAEMVRGVRDQSADADRAVERVVDRLLRRPGRRTAERSEGTAAQPAPRPREPGP